MLDVRCSMFGLYFRTNPTFAIERYLICKYLKTGGRPQKVGTTKGELIGHGRSRNRQAGRGLLG